MAAYTPMMQQYLETKKQYQDCILLYRLGDFYEMFFEDALTASKVLEITLTGKDCGQEERAPMCGIPYHAVEGYLDKLVAGGYKAAICEQVEDPKTAKGLVKREVVRIVTPGTNFSSQALEESRNNYIMALFYDNTTFGIATADITTGDFHMTQVDESRKVMDEITRFSPAEIICNHYFVISGVDLDGYKERTGTSISYLDEWYSDEKICQSKILEHFNVNSLTGLGLDDYTSGTLSAGMLLLYLYETQKNALPQMTRIVPYQTDRFMILDTATRRNLELTETLREKQKRGSLLWVLDKTKTAMGARLLRRSIEQPFISKERIEHRLDAIEFLNDDVITRDEIREYLSSVYDLERLMSRISYRSATPRDLIAFKRSLMMLPSLKYLLRDATVHHLKEVFEDLDPLEDLYDLIDRSINDDPPISIKEGGIIKDGYHEKVDQYRQAKTDGKQWLAKMEMEAREQTGIKNLRIKYNKVFGYYLEVTNSYKALVPEEWKRKQTMANAERYITPELKELEDTILGAEEKLFSLEYDLFGSVRDKIGGEIKRIQKTASALARLDMYAALAFVAERRHFVRPHINENGFIRIKNGRHPVVEQMIQNDSFVPNDIWLDNESQRIAIITGPNMAGKSTYMRQAALIVLMAQMGSFVPADSADIGIVDRIFTRVGASDDLASGQSTFMVEMNEVANILRNATSNSLLILDEIGRGTSTFDGLSIAWAVVEHISSAVKAKTLFATHYHELTELEGRLEGVNNYCIAVSENGDDIVFLRKIITGGADRSYGIQVARLAGIPENVIARAKDIAAQLSNADIAAKARAIAVSDPVSVSESISEHSLKAEPSDSLINQQAIVCDKIMKLDLARLTPLEAINLLYSYRDELEK